MNPNHWAEVERVLHAAAARPAGERAAFLVEACAGDDALRREVESLLAQPASDRGFLDSPAAHQTSATFELRAGVVKAEARRVELSESLDDAEHSSILVM